MAGFGIPPKGEEIQQIISQRLKQAISEEGAKVTIDWRGEQRHLYVISMPVDMLYFNPDTHRIRAQRTLDPERNRATNRARGRAQRRLKNLFPEIFDLILAEERAKEGLAPFPLQRAASTVASDTAGWQWLVDRYGEPCQAS
jgi:glutamine synthetase adenylyltransferase